MSSSLLLLPDHPIIFRREEVRAKRAAAEAFARAERERRQRQRAARGGSEASIVDQFNARHDIAALLDRYGYKQARGSNHWRSPYQTSKSYATRVQEDHWISLSSSDAGNGIGRASKNGSSCFGDAFDLFVHFEHGSDFTEAVRAYAAETRERADTVGGPEWSRIDPKARQASEDGQDFAHADDAPDEAEDQFEERPSGDEPMPTPFHWRDPKTLPTRPWLYGRHLIRKNMSVTVAPGGVGKSSLTICEGLAMASGRTLLNEWVAGQLNVWIFNLEDPRDELERRIIGAMMYHQVAPEEIAGRLYVDTGRERELCTAINSKTGVTIVRPVIEALERQLKSRKIDVLVVDPFVSSHRAPENDNSAIDYIAKEWARLADRCNCAIELVHHTRKTNGEEATTEDGRGAYALLAAARSGRVLNRMTDVEKASAGVANDPATYFSVTRDKANLAPLGKREWRRMASVDLGNGIGLGTSDSVGVAVAWEWPDAFDGMSVADLLEVQRAVDSACKEGRSPRLSDQAGERWIGVLIAEIIGLDAVSDRTRIKKILSEWIKSKALVRVEHEDETRRKRPCIEVGEWATE